MSEKFEVEKIGGICQPNSGRGKKKKADGIVGIFNFDVKESKVSFNLSRSVWAKIQTDAFQSGNYTPALKIVLGEESKLRLWVVDESVIHDYLRLLGIEGLEVA
jgi:hypothetical protein